jgi:exodeoxyribonuclease VII large subunit
LERAERQILNQHHNRWGAAAAAVRHYDVRRVLSGMKKDLATRVTAMISVTRNLLLEGKVRLDRIDTALQALSPLAILERGYALVFDPEGNLLKDARRVKVGEEISARLAHGEIQASVTKKHP